MRSGSIPRKWFSTISLNSNRLRRPNRAPYDGDGEERDLSPVEMEELERRSQRKQLIGGAVILLLGPFLYFTFLGRHSGGSARRRAGQSPPTAAVIPAQA